MIFLIILVSMIFIIKATATANPSTAVGHDPSEIGQGIFGWEPNSLYTFPNDLNINNLLTTKDLNTTNSITLRGTKRNYWPYTDCIDYTSGFIKGSASITCPSQHPIPMRGGCNSECSWMMNDMLSGSTQSCSVNLNIGSYCDSKAKELVQARITCCKN